MEILVEITKEPLSRQRKHIVIKMTTIKGTGMNLVPFVLLKMFCHENTATKGLIYIINQIAKKIKSIIQTPEEHRNQRILDDVSEITKFHGITMKELADLIYKNNSLCE